MQITRAEGPDFTYENGKLTLHIGLPEEKNGKLRYLAGVSVGDVDNETTTSDLTDTVQNAFTQLEKRGVISASKAADYTFANATAKERLESEQTREHARQREIRKVEVTAEFMGFFENGELHVTQTEKRHDGEIRIRFVRSTEDCPDGVWDAYFNLESVYRRDEQGGSI